MALKRAVLLFFPVLYEFICILPDFNAHEFGYVGIVYFLGKKMEKTEEKLTLLFKSRTQR